MDVELFANKELAEILREHQNVPQSSEQNQSDQNHANIIQEDLNKFTENNSDKSNNQSRQESTSTNNSDSSKKDSQNTRHGLDPESLMFRDGRRRIDMVLAWEEENEDVMTVMEVNRRDHRRSFQENMIKKGLELELEDKSQSFDEKTYFLKIHLPWILETRYAELMNLKLPTEHLNPISADSVDEQNTDKKYQRWKNLIKKIENIKKLHVKDLVGNDKERFILKDRASSYSNAQRSLMVFQILLRTKLEISKRYGIRRFLNDGTYLACYPLHEGRYDKNLSNGTQLDRRQLYLTWARPSQWYKKQPLSLIRKYFGDKIALYFCWLGFYTEMLIFPAIVGTLCFLYGLVTFNSEDNTPSKDICDLNGIGNTTLCPLCDKACNYQNLSESCLLSQIAYLFDNPSTVFYAIFMSFWATTFLELWKRKQCELVWEWDLHNIEPDGENRPEYEINAKEFRINPVTREKEPYMSTYSKTIRFVASSAVVFFMISIVLSAVLATTIYRISLEISVTSWFFILYDVKLFAYTTSAFLYLIVIMILTPLYHHLAIRLTNLENPRTQSEYEKSLAFKIYFFEFINFYSSLIYIAFFKGRFFAYPGDQRARRNIFFRLKNDICDPAGCLSELCIELAIIMIGRQCLHTILEFSIPLFSNWWRQRKHKAATKVKTHLHMSWERDYHMQDPGRLALFHEYLKMILQYGFVTLFVAAFPLAPLFAFLNNIAAIRVDALKMVTQARRPVAKLVDDIGAWYGILQVVTYTAVVSNAFVIAYTSDFIPKLAYKLISNDFSLKGYINHSLSIFNTSEYNEEWGYSNEKDPDTCKYRAYRNNPTDEDPYNLSPHYWHIFGARLAFVIVFEHFVFVITAIMQFVIPDIPAKVRKQNQREQLLAKEENLHYVLNKAKKHENL